jgi:putative polyketide hydroxylase
MTRGQSIIKTPVLIVGAGPVGMMSALLLARQGVRSVLIERRNELTAHPKGRGFNARSMELFRQCGMLDDMIAAQPKTEQVANVAIGQALDDPHLRIMPFFGAEQSIREFSPATNVVGGQDIVEMVVVSHLRRFGAVNVIYDCELDQIAQGESGVTARAKRDDGTHLHFAADYVIAADGARSPVRGLLGRTMEQRSPILGQNVNILFRADLSGYMEKFGSCAFFTKVNPPGHAGPGLRGIMAIMSTVRSPDERTYNVVLNPDETPDMITMDNAGDWIRREVGLPADFPIEIKSISPWDAGARMIDKFRDGRVLFAGDAARTIPPAGALGMNTGLIDANNACWRIAMAVKGFASDRFLDDFATERQGHSETIVAASLENMRGAIANGPSQGEGGLPSGGPGKSISNAPAFDFRSGPAPGGRPPSCPPPEGGPPRGAPPAQRSQMGLYLGFMYQSGSVIPDGSTPPLLNDPKNEYVPHATPGARAPHIWIDPRYQHSVLDLFGSGFVLLAASCNGWAIAAEKIGFETTFPLRMFDLQKECRTPEIWAGWKTLYGVGDEGAVLVRPDGMIAWRSKDGADDAHAALLGVFDQIMGKRIEGEAA